MLRDRRFRHPEPARRDGNRRRTVSKALHDPATDRMGDRSERIVSHMANYIAWVPSGTPSIPDHSDAGAPEWEASPGLQPTTPPGRAEGDKTNGRVRPHQEQG